tara:strand:- start:303 stop:533 length:231 start_codon:yes stop_codon:yes gene_type:complete
VQTALATPKARATRTKIQLRAPKNDHLKGMFRQALNDANEALPESDKLKLPQGLKQISKTPKWVALLFSPPKTSRI